MSLSKILLSIIFLLGVVLTASCLYSPDPSYKRIVSTVSELKRLPNPHPPLLTGQEAIQYVSNLLQFVDELEKGDENEKWVVVAEYQPLEGYSDPYLWVIKAHYLSENFRACGTEILINSEGDIVSSSTYHCWSNK